jgi:Flp pilus assembly protein TadG
MRFKSIFEQLIRSQAGVAGVEFAIVAPVTIALMLCMADIGLGLYAKMRVQNAAQVGAQYAAYHGFDTSGIASAVSQAVNLNGVSLTPSPSQFCGCATASGIATNDCSSSCPNTGLSPGTYVVVSTQATYNTLLPYPGLPNSYSFASQSTVRSQ